jgi:hypothetical protein
MDRMSAGGMKNETTPATSDIEETLKWLQTQLLADQLELLTLGQVK